MENIMANEPEDTSAKSSDPTLQGIFDQKSTEIIEEFGESLEKGDVDLAFCVIFDKTNGSQPKVFYRGELFEITKHVSKILNQMKYKLMNEINGNF